MELTKLLLRDAIEHLKAAQPREATCCFDVVEQLSTEHPPISSVGADEEERVKNSDSLMPDYIDTMPDMVAITDSGGTADYQEVRPAGDVTRHRNPSLSSPQSYYAWTSTRNEALKDIRWITPDEQVPDELGTKTDVTESSTQSRI